LRQNAVLQDPVDYAAPEYRERALSYRFAHGRCDYCPDSFLRLRIHGCGRLRMLQQRGYQRTFWRAENPLIPHQCF
jgi:hypothetical protein